MPLLIAWRSHVCIIKHNHITPRVLRPPHRVRATPKRWSLRATLTQANSLLTRVALS